MQPAFLYLLMPLQGLSFLGFFACGGIGKLSFASSSNTKTSAFVPSLEGTAGAVSVDNYQVKETLKKRLGFNYPQSSTFRV